MSAFCSSLSRHFPPSILSYLCETVKSSTKPRLLCFDFDSEALAAKRVVMLDVVVFLLLLFPFPVGRERQYAVPK